MYLGMLLYKGEYPEVPRQPTALTRNNDLAQIHGEIHLEPYGRNFKDGERPQLRSWLPHPGRRDRSGPKVKSICGRQVILPLRQSLKR